MSGIRTLFLALLLLFADTLFADTTTGADAAVTVEVSAGDDRLDRAVVWLELVGDVAVPEPESADPMPRVDQVNQAFSPEVLPVSVGQEVRFQNSDAVAHHVYSFSQAKRFELPLFRAGESHAVRFEQPGVVVLGCNIHDHMVGYVVVADTPWVDRADAEGRARFEVPAGSYRLSVWHPRLKTPGRPAVSELEATPGEQIESVTLDLEPASPSREFSREALRGG